MERANQIKQTIRDIVPKPVQHLYLAEVTAVQTDTCTVRIDSLTLSDVYLRPVLDTSQTPFRVTPAVGSFVIVADLSMGRLQRLAVVAVSEAQKIEIGGGTQTGTGGSTQTGTGGSTQTGTGGSTQTGTGGSTQTGTGGSTQTGTGGSTRIEINGSANGGLINIESLKSYLEALEQSIGNALFAVGESTAASGATARATFNTSIQSARQHLQTLEDTKVTH